MSAQHPVPVNPCCLLPCCGGFYTDKFWLLLSTGRAVGSNLTRTFQSTVLPPPNFSILCKNHRISLTASARQAKQPSSKQRSSWVFSLGCWGWKGKFVKKPSRNPGGERRGLELATVNEKHNSNADMYFTKLFAQLHGKEWHQLQFKVEKKEKWIKSLGTALHRSCSQGFHPETDYQTFIQ